MRSLRRSLLVTACLFSVGGSLAFVGGDTAGPGEGANFTAARYIEHVKFLASEELEGRRPGTPGIEQAAVYIAYQFMQDGLKPAGVSNTYFQPWELRNRKQVAPEEARFEATGVDGSFAVNADWVTMPFSKTDSVEGPLAFAGYGIEYNVPEEETAKRKGGKVTGGGARASGEYAGGDARLSGSILDDTNSTSPPAGVIAIDVFIDDKETWTAEGVRVTSAPASRPREHGPRIQDAEQEKSDDTAGNVDIYDDYADFDATGKILMVFRYEPRAESPDAKFGGKTSSVHSLFSRKAKLAAERGAKGLIIVNPPDRDSDGDGTPDEDTLYKWSERDAGQTYDLPMIQMTQAAAERLLKAANMPDLKTLQAKLEKERKSLSADLKAGDDPIKVSLAPGLRSVEARNVLGLLEGTDLKDEYIVIGSHFDHLGRVTPMRGGGGEAKIHNGADDNASGTAGILELARVISAGPRPRRSILFMTFSAEEMGLLGSDYFVKHPTIPLSKIKAMINLDMIGRLEQKKFTISGLDTAKEFADMVAKYAKEFGVEYKPMTSSTDTFFGASDHYSFHKKKIPVVFPFTGTHRQYHQPEDDWDLIDAEGATKILSMFHGIAMELANMSNGPTLTTPEDRQEIAAKLKGEDGEKPMSLVDQAVGETKRREAEARGDSATSAPAAASTGDGEERPRPRRPRVRLGISPSTETYSGETKGVGVEAVSEGGIAAKAGVEEGDIITKIRGVDIIDMETYMSSLADAKDGEEFEIVVKRKNETLTLKATVVMPKPRVREEPK